MPATRVQRRTGGAAAWGELARLDLLGSGACGVAVRTRALAAAPNNAGDGPWGTGTACDAGRKRAVNGQSGLRGGGWPGAVQGPAAVIDFA